jgi:hypothetical protein
VLSSPEEEAIAKIYATVYCRNPDGKLEIGAGVSVQI